MTEKNNPLRRYVITGGPATGKSTLLNVLSVRGYPIVPEAARIIIEREMAADSDCLPWRNLQKFQNTVSQTQFELENQYTQGEVFSDRSIIDGFAYSKLDGIVVPEVVIQNGRNRYDLVFLLEPLPVYETDSSRKESREKALLIQKELESAYKEFRYSPIKVPVLSPEERADFVLNIVKQEGAK